MSFNGDKSPSLNQQLPAIRLHSPLALTGAFIYILREYFSEGILPWRWKDNKTTTDIFIESGLEKGTEISDVKPAIYVSKGQTVYEQVVLGDRDQHQPNILEKRLEHFYSTVSTDIRISCVSPRRGESEMIGDVVQNFINASKRIIMSRFAFRDMTPIILNSVQSFELDDTLFTSIVMFRCQFESRWATIPGAPILSSLGINLTDEQTNQIFLNIALHTTGEPNTP